MADFIQHNAEAQEVWQSYHAGQPVRVPMVLTSGPRIWVLDPSLNREGITWKQYLQDPAVLYDVTLKHKYYVAHTIPQDMEMGIPEKEWDIGIEFGNVYEESWFGCEIIYPEGQIATTRPRYAGANKHEIFERGMPGPFDGFMDKIFADYEYFLDRAGREDFHDRPVKVWHPVPLGTDGPLTVATGIRGPELFEDMLADEDYYHRLMSFITEAIIQRILAWRQRLGLELRPVRGWFADDAIQFLSTRTYREKVLPYHRRFFQALYGEGPHNIHLCGNVQRHFLTVTQELNIRALDTGFPINFQTLRSEIGEAVEVQGGVPVSELLSRSPDAITERTRAILQSGVTQGGRFILKEANDLAPCIPLENMQAMYAAVRQYGVYPRSGVL
jgi:hypothetical protein